MDTGVSHYRKSPEKMSTPFVTARFVLSDDTKQYLASLTPQFGYNGFGECVYMRTYSRQKPDGSQELWHDTVTRVTEGILSIRKDHFLKSRLAWSDDAWQPFARKFSDAMFKMHFLPPGRGLWAAGSSFMYERGSAALYNCGACTSKDLIEGVTWTFSALMYGAGIGGDTAWEGNAVTPNKTDSFAYVIPDSREGWVESLKLLLQAYIPDTNGKIGLFPIFDYSIIRPRGTPLKGFGGTASGPDPLIKLHRRVEVYLDTYLEYLSGFTIAKPSDALFTGLPNGHYHGSPSIECFVHLVERLRPVDYDWMDDATFADFSEKVRLSALNNPHSKRYDPTRCVVDILNAVGACVVAGNIRRSSEIVLGRPDDPTFMHLKDYKVNPEREVIGWMSNNTVRLTKTEDFHLLPQIAMRIRDNGEPGVFNQLNVTRYGRVRPIADPTKIRTREMEPDQATLCNPCVTADTLILTKEGWRECLDLIGKQFIAIVDGKEYSSTNEGFFYTGEKEVYELVLKNGMRIKATGNHVFFTRTGEVKLDDMSTNTEVILPNNRGYTWDLNGDEFAEGYFCGQLIGDGTFGARDDREMIPMIDLWVDKKYVNPRDYKPFAFLENWGFKHEGRSDFNGFSRIAEGDTWTKYRMTRKAFLKISDKYEIYPLEKGTSSFSIGIIAGLFDSDGTIIGDQKKGVSVRIYQTEIHRLEAVQRLLNMFGVSSVIYKNRHKADAKMMPDEKGGEKEYMCKASHELVISGDSIIRFVSVIGFLDNDKTSKLNRIISNYKRTPNKSKFFSKVESIIPIGIEKVYDCTIPEISKFNANGMMVHNCSEIPLENFELCNLSEVFPTRCLTPDGKRVDETLFFEAVHYATFYSSTVSLLPTHWEKTNEVISRNHRIGVSMSGIADLYEIIGCTEMTRLCRSAYRLVREVNTELAHKAGVPPSIRVTTVKPSGSISQLAGVSPGMHFPTFHYAIRRMRISEDSPIVPILKASNYPCEKDTYSDHTLIFEFPIDQGKTRSAEEVTVWEQFALLEMLQSNYADNMVSVTVYFNPEMESAQIEKALAIHAPMIKSCSMLPHSKKGAYRQAPYEGITKEKYEELLGKVKPIDWTSFGKSDGILPVGCSNDTCSL